MFHTVTFTSKKSQYRVIAPTPNTPSCRQIKHILYSQWITRKGRVSAAFIVYTYTVENCKITYWIHFRVIKWDHMTPLNYYPHVKRVCYSNTFTEGSRDKKSPSIFFRQCQWEVSYEILKGHGNSHKSPCSWICGKSTTWQHITEIFIIDYIDNFLLEG